MKKLVIAIFLSLAVLGTGFSQKLMEIRVQQVSISIPTGWLAQYTDNATTFILYSPMEQDDTFQENANLVLEKLPQKYSVKAYLKAAQDNIRAVYGDFALVEEGGNYHIISGSYNDTMLMQIQYVAIKNDTAYILTFTSNPESFASYIDTFKSIQKTFKLL